MAPPARDPAQRFAEAYITDPNGCWLWQRALYPSGYGEFPIGHQRNVRAHRWAYEHFVGPIPDGLEIDHLCRVRRCVNPAHLEAVTRLENVRRSRIGEKNRAKTHCPKGHPYDEANTRIERRVTLLGLVRFHRACRTCERERQRVT